MTEHRPRPDLHIVDKPEQQPPNRLLPDYPRIMVTITARNGGALWAQAGPYLLNEADLKGLCSVAAGLAAKGRPAP